MMADEQGVWIVNLPDGSSYEVSGPKDMSDEEMQQQFQMEMLAAENRAIRPTGPSTTRTEQIGAQPSYRLTPEQEGKLTSYVNEMSAGNPGFSPEGYADLALQLGKEAGVPNLPENAGRSDPFWRQTLKNVGDWMAQNKGRATTGGFDYSAADTAYQQQLDEANRQRAASGNMPKGTAQEQLIAAGLLGGPSGFLPNLNMGGDIATDAERRRLEILASQTPSAETYNTAGGVLGALALPQKGVQGLLANTVYGGTLGSGQAGPGNREQGYITGASIYPIVSGGMSAATKGVSALVGGIKAPVSQRLYEQGIMPSYGDIAREYKNRFVSGASDVMAGLPFTRALAGARQGEQREAASLAAGNIAVKESGEKVTSTGLQQVQELDDIVNQAYMDSLAPMTLQADTQFARDQARLIGRISAINRAQRVPQPLRDVSTAWDDLVMPYIGQNGVITGEGLQAIKRGLLKERGSLSGVPGAKSAINLLKSMEDSVINMAKRQQPDLFGKYVIADKMYKKSQIVKNSVMRARSNETPYVPTPSQLLSSTDAPSAMKYGSSPELRQLGTDMQSIMIPGLKTSGTSERETAKAVMAGAFPSLATGLGVAANYAAIEPSTALLLGGAMLPMTRTGQRFVAGRLLGPKNVFESTAGSAIGATTRPLSTYAGVENVNRASQSLPGEDYMPSDMTPEEMEAERLKMANAMALGQTYVRAPSINNPYAAR